MQSAFDSVLKAENEAEEIMNRARQEIATMKADVDAQKAQREQRDVQRLAAAQTEILEAEKYATQEKLAQLDADWEREKKELDRQCALNREAVRALLVKKVISQNGDC